ncbi:hypothetical protein HZF02_04240 [Pseudomonas yamanorum]|nr:hypothetical protein HZF02_04240 [Pseudomonas yamanorum]
MKKIKPPLFTPAEFAKNINESIGNTTIDEAIDRNHGILLQHFFEPLLERDEHLKLLEDIRLVTNDPELQGKLMENWEHEVYETDWKTNGINERINTLLQHVRYACLYLELARAAEENKHRNRAWAFNNEASLMIGEIIEKSETILNAMEADKRSAQNSKNGKGRIKNFLPVKEEAVRLLEEMKPEGGWPTLTSAVTALDEPLAHFILSNRISGMTSTNIRVLLEKTWIPKDELVNPAWEKTKQAKTR